MTYCLNPDCPQPQNPDVARFCQRCGSQLLLGDRYRILRPLGAGGFGRTFLASDEYKPSKPRCVVKQLLPQAQGTNNQTKAAEMFHQEAERLEQLGEHPQIPNLLAHFTSDGRQYLIQEYIDGQDLEQELATTGAFDESQIRQMLESLLPVLQYIHDRRVIHRDIKPSNLIRRRSDGQLVLVDFGAAKATSATYLAQTGTSIGSAGYTAPEQTLGKACYASDLYSLGVTCIHLLTQVPPFDLFDSREGEWVWRDYLVDNPVGDRLGSVLDKLLQPATSRRYATGSEVLKDLKAPRLPKTKATATTPHHQIVTDPSTVQALAELDTSEVTRTGVSYVLWAGIFFGAGGLHRLYNGKIGTGLLWMFTGGLFGVGQFIDLFLIPRMSEEYRAKAMAKLGLLPQGGVLPSQHEVAQTIAPPTQGELRAKIVLAAQKRGGQITVTQAVMDTSIDFDRVEELLQGMVRAGYVSLENDIHTGAVIYRFNEL